MKRYDIRMDDADGEESATGAWVMWIDAQAALAAKDAALRDAQEAHGRTIALAIEEKAAKDAALAELLDAMKHARAAFERDYIDMILDEAIAKHRPEEGADNA